MTKGNDQFSKVSQIPLRMIASIKSMLVSEEQKLVSQKNKLKKEDPFADKSRVNGNSDVESEVDELVGHERNEAVRSEIDKLLIRVRQALTMIKMGRYGICSRCGKMIDVNRLAINPTAVYCVDCEKKIESKQE